VLPSLFSQHGPVEKQLLHSFSPQRAFNKSPDWRNEGPTVTSSLNCLVVSIAIRSGTLDLTDGRLDPLGVVFDMSAF